jgi:hypothetical protein
LLQSEPGGNESSSVEKQQSSVAQGGCIQSEKHPDSNDLIIFSGEQSYKFFVRTLVVFLFAIIQFEIFLYQRYSGKPETHFCD